MGYTVLDQSGDVGIRAWGPDYDTAFAETAYGMYSLISDIATFGTGTIVEITVADETPEGLLVNFLNELIYRFEVDGFVARTVTISSITEWSLNAILQGEAFDPEHHEQRLLLKAATYHNILVKRTGQGCMVEVLFDI